jgi:hypothetical protein
MHNYLMTSGNELCMPFFKKFQGRLTILPLLLFIFHYFFSLNLCSLMGLEGEERVEERDPWGESCGDDLQWI